MKQGSKPMPVKRQSEIIMEVTEDLELLCIGEEVNDMERAKEESRWVEENKRNFEDDKLLLISRGQVRIPFKNGNVQNFNFYIWSN